VVADYVWYKGDPTKAVQKYELPAKYLMFPGQFWVHKNHLMLFEAIRILVQEKRLDVVLLCSGRQSDYRFPEHFSKIKEFIAKNNLEQNIRLLGLIDRHDQIQLMRAAAAIMNPSLFEGWCLMVEEARSLGKPVFLSDLPIHREQDPPQAHYFDPHDPRELAELLARHWPLLRAGVVPHREALARQTAKNSEIHFARHFNEIVDKALGKELV